MTLFKQLRGVRGATTADEDSREAITSRISELLSEMLRRNGLTEDDLVSVLFTATNDLVSVFPATAARELGFATVPLICAQELDITNATPRCLRILIHARSRRSAVDVEHVFLHGASNLRNDLNR